MSTKRPHRTNRILIGAAAMVGVLAGAAGISAAVTEVDGDDGRRHEVDVDDDGAVVGRDVDDDDGRDGRDGEGQEDDEVSDPALVEAATVTKEEAERAALAEVPGTVRRIHVEREDGIVVWDVEVDGEDGRRSEVQVDAATGTIVEVDRDD